MNTDLKVTPVLRRVLANAEYGKYVDTPPSAEEREVLNQLSRYGLVERVGPSINYRITLDGRLKRCRRGWET